MNETLFYVLGITLAVLAVGLSFFGLRNEERFPSNALMRLTALGFAALVAGTAAFAVLNARDEQEHRRAELASEAQAATPETAPAPAPAPAPSGGGAAAPPSGQGKKAGGAAKPSGQAGKAGGGGAKPSGAGPGGTLQLAADPTAIAYDTKQLSSKPGEVTIDFDNPSQVEHDVAIESGGKEIAKSELVAQGKASVSVELAPGSYTFFCTVPGHREAGMEGTLTVK